MTEAGVSVLLLVSVLSPLAGAMILGRDQGRARQSALATTLFTLVLCVLVIAAYPPGAKDFARIQWSWMPGMSSSDELPVVSFSLSLDGLNLWFYGLTALLGVVGVLISWEAIQSEAARFYRCWLLLETGMLGVFLAQDILLFYVFFEFTLVPLFFLIGIWGSAERHYAAIKFFLFTLAGSVLTFLGLLAIVLWVCNTANRLTFSIPLLTDYLQNLHGTDRMPILVQQIIFWALFAGFAIKVPLFPLHTWLPLAHVEAPAAGSVVLAGVLLKVGGYGFLRFSIPMLPEATASAMPYLLILSVAGIIYGALVALAQKDIKRLIAYSSISHLGFCMLGIFALNRPGVQGGVLQMLNHGLSTGALFALVGMMYERYHTRQIAEMGGLARRLPWLAFFMMVASLASIGLPGLNGFVGEFLALWGMFHRAWKTAPAEWAAWYRVLSILAVSGVVLGAWYMLWMIQRVFFGPLREPGVPGVAACPTQGSSPPCDAAHRVARESSSVHAEGSHGGHRSEETPSDLSEEMGGPTVSDLSWREIAALTPLVVLMVWIGVYPKFFLDRIAPTVEELSAPAATMVRPPAEEQLPEPRLSGSGLGKWKGNSPSPHRGTRGDVLPAPGLLRCPPLGSGGERDTFVPLTPDLLPRRGGYPALTGSIAWPLPLPPAGEGETRSRGCPGPGTTLPSTGEGRKDPSCSLASRQVLLSRRQERKASPSGNKFHSAEILLPGQST